MSVSYSRIILVTDTSQNSRAASQAALELAKLNSARLLVVDTIHRPSVVSQWISSNADDLFDIVFSQKRERLDRFANMFVEAGLDIETRLLIGNSSEEIVRMAIAEQADLVIRYAKGVSSRMPGPFGRTARNLIRLCPCPLLLVTTNRLVANPQVVACVNVEHRSDENKAIIQETQKLAGNAANWQLLCCWDFKGKEYMAGYVSDELLSQYSDESARNFQAMFDDFLAQHDLTASADRVHVRKGDPAKLIPDFCREKAADVAVMSSASLNHPLYRLLGSTVESVLETLPCSVLVVKPIGFKSPVKPANSTAEATG